MDFTNGGPVSPDRDRDEDDAPARPISALDALRAEVERDVRLDLLELDVPARPQWGMVYDPNIESDVVRNIAKKAEVGPKNKRTVDPLRFSTRVILTTHRAFLFQPSGSDEWARVTDDSDKALTFHDDEIIEMVGAATPADAVVAWYATDGHVIQTATEILEAAGYGEDDINPLMAQ